MKKVMTISRAVVHKGSAHRDEFLALCILMGFLDRVVPVSRRDPSAEELADPTVGVIDVGQMLDEEHNTLDHHQYREGDAALTLVLKACGLYETAAAMFAWVAFSNALDTTGPFATAAAYDMSPEALFATVSPIEGQLLQMFGEMDEVPAWMLELMKGIGDGIISTIRQTQKRVAELKASAQLVEVKGVQVIVSTIADKPALALEEFRKLRYPEAGISVCPDDRGAGWTLYRFAGATC